MQNYIEIAEKNGVTLLNEGSCQFCGAKTEKGIHECMEIFNLGFQGVDFSESSNHIYRFLLVDAHILQHPEIHGRWSNHFHLSRLHLIFNYGVEWSYKLSPLLSDQLNKYKAHNQEESLVIPKALNRGEITSIDILRVANNETECKESIKDWAMDVHQAWNDNHEIVDRIATAFLKEK